MTASYVQGELNGGNAYPTINYNSWYAIFVFINTSGIVDVFGDNQFIVFGQNILPSAYALNYVLCDNNKYRFIGFCKLNSSTVDKFTTEIISNVSIQNSWDIHAYDWSYTSNSVPTTQTLKTAKSPPLSWTLLRIIGRATNANTVCAILSINPTSFNFTNDYNENYYTLNGATSTNMTSNVDIRVNSISQYYIKNISAPDNWSDYIGAYTIKYIFNRDILPN
jgi:hypothetical protein